MSQQASDLPRFARIIGHYKILVGITALLGLLAGTIFAALNPPESSSEASVLFAAPLCPAGAVCGGPMFSLGDTEAAWLKAFPGEVQVRAVTGSVALMSVAAGTPAEAKAMADAAARSYIAYADSLSYLGEHPSANLLSPAWTASETTPPKHLFDGALLGVLLGALAGVAAALVAGQTIIDPVILPEGLGAGEATRGPDPETGYASTGVSLEQLALEYSRRRADSDTSEAELP